MSLLYGDDFVMLLLVAKQILLNIWLRSIFGYRRMAENGFAPPLGNFADISYLVEN